MDPQTFDFSICPVFAHEKRIRSQSRLNRHTKNLITEIMISSQKSPNWVMDLFGCEVVRTIHENDSYEFEC